MQKMSRGVVKWAVVFIFFTCLCISLFLGDGSQAAVEEFFAITLILLYGLLFFSKIDIGAPSKPVAVAWTCLIVYTCLRGAFSDSVALSLSWLVRLAEGYLTFLLFRSLSRDTRVNGVFIRSFVSLGLFTGLVSLVLLAFPGLSRFLPQANLLSATYGHNYVANLLLLVLPVFAFYVLQYPTVRSIVAYFLWCALIVLTFSRGVWLLSFGFLLLLAWRRRFTNRKVFPIVISALLFALAVLTVFSISTGFFHAPRFTMTAPLHEQIIKSPPWNDGRFGYWEGAIAGFMRSPIVGSGPGTFVIASKIGPVTADKSTWAHSFPLQILEEMGLIGAMLYFVLMILVFLERFRAIRRGGSKNITRNNIIRWGLFYGAILLFVYSFYEMVFDFLTVWILFWAVLGMLNTDRENADSRRAGPIFLLVVLLSLLALFYIVYSTHTALQFYKPHDTITLVTALPNERNIRDYLDSLPSSRAFPRWQISAILFMHKWDPDVLAALARATEDHNPHLSNQLFLESIQLDPASTDDKRQYILFVASHPQFVDRLTAPGLMHLLFQTATERQTSVIKPIINYQSPFFIGAFIELMHGSKAIAVNWHFFSKFYYLWGLSVMRTDPNAVVPLLSEAALLEPVWSYYHLELASYALYRLKNQNLANKTLSACQQLPFAGEDCLFFSSQPLPISGYYKQKIIDIH